MNSMPVTVIIVLVIPSSVIGPLLALGRNVKLIQRVRLWWAPCSVRCQIKSRYIAKAERCNLISVERQQNRNKNRRPCEVKNTKLNYSHIRKERYKHAQITYSRLPTTSALTIKQTVEHASFSAHRFDDMLPLILFTHVMILRFRYTLNTCSDGLF